MFDTSHVSNYDEWARIHTDPSGRMADDLSAFESSSLNDTGYPWRGIELSEGDVCLSRLGVGLSSGTDFGVAARDEESIVHESGFGAHP